MSGSAEAMAGVPLRVAHSGYIKWAIDVGVKTAWDRRFDGVDRLPAGFDGVQNYPRIEELLRKSGLPERQIEKVCFRNFLTVFKEVLG
jgi:microsomal dipeptidase-like Zn-dependent dipeptidase